MNYYNDYTELQSRGIDYDLIGAIEHNDPGFGVEDIDEVAAVVEGENDGESWHWILEMKDGSFVYAEGWCDYTGWDCQSGMSVYEAKTLLGALDLVPDEKQDIFQNLYRQVNNDTKEKTWREKTDSEFAGVLYGVDLAKIKQANNRDNLLGLITKRLPTADQLLQAKAEGEAMKGPPLPPTTPQPYAPDYEVETLTSFDAIMVTAYLLRSGIWFCVRPQEDGRFEVVVKYADREALARFVAMT